MVFNSREARTPSTGKLTQKSVATCELFQTSSSNDPSTFIIQPTPWHYSFFGIMKLDKIPTLSPLSLDPQRSQSFPDIKF